MNVVCIVAGALIILGMFGALFAVIAREVGWRWAFGIFAFTAGVVVLAVAASFLISYGVTS